jgi:site-specific DNA recombinase
LKFNRRSSRTREWKPDDEIVTVDVPAIIEPNVFEQVQRQLHARSPRTVAPRVTTGPILLTGLAICATCGGGMTLRTGTSKTGLVHRYYTCSASARKGKTVCKGRSMPMGKLDGLVTDHLMERLFQPQRLAKILASLSSRRTEKAEALSTRIIALQREVTDGDEKLKRLYRLVEDGMTDLDEVLKDRLNVLKAERDRANAALDRARPHAGSPIQIDPALIEKFGRTMRENFSTGSVPFRKAHLRSLIDVVEVDDAQIRIKGSKDVLERAVLAGGTGAVGGSQMSTRWRATADEDGHYCFAVAL